MVAQAQPVFPATFVAFPSGRSQPRGILSGGVSHTTLLSIAYAVVVRRYTWSAYYP